MLDINNIPSIPDELEDYIENGYDIPMTDEEYEAWLDEELKDATVELENTSDILDNIDSVTVYSGEDIEYLEFHL